MTKKQWEYNTELLIELAVEKTRQTVSNDEEREALIRELRAMKKSFPEEYRERTERKPLR